MQLWVNAHIPEVIPFLLEDEDIVNYLQQNPAAACRLFFRFDPYPYQIKVLEDNAPFQAIRMARQLGKSFTLGAKVLLKLIFNANYKILVIAPSLRQTIYFRDRIETHLTYMPKSLRSMLFKRIQRQKIETFKGSALNLAPNSPDLIRGYTADLIIVDEAAVIKNDRYLFDNILYPMLSSTNGGMVLSSTPKNKSSVFYDACNDPRFSQHHYDYNIGLAVGQLKEPIIAIQAEKYKNNPFMWQTELMAMFYEDTDKFITYNMLRNAVDPMLQLDDYTNLLPGNYYVGVDFGKWQDFSVIVMLQDLHGKLRLCYLKVFNLGTPYAEVIRQLINITAGLKTVNRIVVDATGVGDYILEDLQNQLKLVEGVKLSLHKKSALGKLLKTQFEATNVAIPDDLDLINNINVVGYKSLESGVTKFICPDGQHDDIFTALMLAVAAAREPKGSNITVI